MRLATIALLALPVVLGANAAATPSAPTVFTRDARFVPAIATAAAAYKRWHRVDETPNVAPTDCAAPAPGAYGRASEVRMSNAADSPHGLKLYYLWASDRDAYAAPVRQARQSAPNPVPVGFAIVKESFAAVPSPPAPTPTAGTHGVGADAYWLPPVTTMTTADGHTFRTGERKDLYVMAKVGDVAGSDGGWIYGTVSPDGAVTSAGRVATCMHCHDEAATHEKLFGLQPVPSAHPAP